MNKEQYIDTHVHLNDEKILSHLDEVIHDALEKNVKRMFVVGWDLESSKCALKLAEKYPFCYAIIGFHPCNIRGYGEKEYEWLAQAVENEKVVAIGEIGFDLHWQDTTLEEQISSFARQVEIAKKVNKPVSIHSRDAAQITFDNVLKTNCDKVGGVIHAYSESVELAKEYVKRGFVLGIGGTLTFKNAKVIKEVVKNLDIKYFVSETDSPYLTPDPYRGTENGPKYIPLIVDKISEIKQISKEEVVSAINDNVLRIFGV